MTLSLTPHWRPAIDHYRAASPAGWRRLLGVSLAVATGLLCSQAAFAQGDPAEQLKINVKKGAGDTHRPGDPPTTIVVEILSDVGTPQPAAEVSFQSKDKGPAVLFGGKRTVTQLSDDSGNVTVSGIRGNGIKGSVPIGITAVFENKRGSWMLSQVNASKPFWTKKNTAIVGVVVGAAGIIAWQLSKPGPTTATINNPQISPSMLPPGIRISIR